MSKKLVSKPKIDVTVEKPKDSKSTGMYINEHFTKDPSELNYKKNKVGSPEILTDRQAKPKTTFFLEEIDDGPRKMTSRLSHYKSSMSIATVETQESEPDYSSQDESSLSGDSETNDLPAELLEEDQSKEYEQTPATSYTEQMTDKKKIEAISVDKERLDTKSFSEEEKARNDKTPVTSNAGQMTRKQKKEDMSSEKKKRITKTLSEEKKSNNKKAEIKTKSIKDKENVQISPKENNNILSSAHEATEIRRSVYRTNDAGYGIEIIIPYYLLPDDSNFEAVVWNPEERGLFLRDYNFAHQQRFRTDIFHIYKRNVNEPTKPKEVPKALSYPDVDPTNITVKVHIPELNYMNGLCLNFRAHIRYRRQWTIVDTKYQRKEGIVSFNCNKMESFCIVSTPKDDKHTITPDGYEFVSEADNRIKVDFPPGAVSKEETMDFEVIPLNRESMAAKIESNPRNCFILAISECLAVNHSVSSFNKPIEIQLPVDDLPGIDSRNVECRYGVFKRQHRGSFRLTDLKVEERNGMPTILVNGFSEYVILKVRSDIFEKLQGLLPEEIDVAVGDKMCCKILFFVGARKPNSISAMLECVTKDSMDEVCQRRRLMGYELVRQCQSPDFFFPVNQRIRIDVSGSFSLTRHIGKGYYFLTFFPIAADNFICFPIEKHGGMGSATYGIISFKEDNNTKRDLHAIHYDPWSSKGKPKSQSNVLSARSAPVSRQMTAASDAQRQKQDKSFDELFFSDKGLLAIAQSLSPDSMFKVVINLDMTKAQYEQITNDYSALTTSSRHLQLLKTALEINSLDSKLMRLTAALRDSDENGIAEKVEKLYFENQRLTRANLERKATVVSIDPKHNT